MDQEKEDKIISNFLHSLGPWGNYIVIGGGYALIIYKLYLADKKIVNFPVGTRDIDSLLPRRIPAISYKDIAKHLHEDGFRHVFKDLDKPATEAYVKNINGIEVEIEFLTDSAVRNDKNKNVIIAGVVAQPLSYLTLSLQVTRGFRTFSNEIGRVVSPGAWIFHKGLTFPRRKSLSKTLKDLYGIWYVVSQLGSFSDEAIEELNMLGRQYPKWFNTFQKNLNFWMEEASPLNWLNLESQDPSGTLRKLVFEQSIKKNLKKKYLKQLKDPKTEKKKVKF
jgi:hypothetical protein